MNQTILSLSRASRALSIGALLALGICGCTNDDLVDQTSPTTGSEANVTLTARIESGAGTRTGHNENDLTDPSKGVKVTWAAGDKISVFTYDDTNELYSTPAIFTLNGIDPDNGAGTFGGTAEPTPKGTGTGDSYVVTYPPLSDLNPPSFPMTGQVQSGNANMDHLGAYDLMIANRVADWKNFTFTGDSHYNALMTFDLDGIPADLGKPKRIILGCTAENPCFKDNSFSEDPNASSLNLDLTGFPAVTTGTQQIKAYMMLAYAFIPAGKSLTITVEGDRNSYTYTSPAMDADGMYYNEGKRYTAKVTAQDTWVKDASTTATYTGADPAVAFDAKKGDGTEAKPFLIENAGHLRTLINGLLSNSGYTGKYFKLATNIDVQMTGGVNWTTIGKSSTPFKGNFDGNGYTISGELKLNGSDNLGFFGVIEGATITNLTMDATISGNRNVGGIVGSIKGTSSHISYCTNSGNVAGAIGYVGGIVGYVEGDSFITGCTNTGTVAGSKQYVGGIAGEIYNGQNTYIIGCTNQGAINITNPTDPYCYGGIVGDLANAVLIACTNQGKVSYNGDGGESFGGIAGKAAGNSNAIIACYNMADVSTISGKYVGGVVGKLGGTTTLTASYNTGRVTTSNILCGAISGGYSATTVNTTISYCQYVLHADNTSPELLIYPAKGTPNTVKENTKRATFAELNVAGVASLNAGITEWNKANAASTAKLCPYHFVAGTAGSTPTLAAGAPVID